MTTVNMHEAKTRLSQLVEAVEAGEEVIIARAGKPVVRLIKADVKPGGVRIGVAKGLLRRVAADFDAPLGEDFLLRPISAKRGR